ncbi:MAG: isopentenyl phosphate kinase [Thermoplasmatales archaeon]
MKIGGSVITDKSRYRRIRMEALLPLCEMLAERRDLIIVHGAGSFGHVLALRYGLDKPGSVIGREMEISRVTNDVAYLNNAVVKTLIKTGISSVGIPPHSVYSGSGINTNIVEKYYASGILPVLYGDVVIDRKHFRILSGDEIMFYLTKKFRPESAAFVTDVDGLYTSDPKVRKDAKLIREVKASDLVAMEGGGDATGSMPGKVLKIMEMAKYTQKVVIINGNYPERLESYLNGKMPLGTVIS